MPEDKIVKMIAIYLFIFVVSVYLISISWPNIRFVDHYYERYEVTESIVERYDLSIPENYGIKGSDGRHYSLYGLGWSALAVPFYIIGDFLGRGSENFVTVMNPMVGGATVTLVFLFSIALGYSKRVSLAVAFFYGFGTMAWPLAKHPFDHVVETFFILLSVYSLYIYTSRNKILYLVNSAVFLGIALNTRLTSSLVLPALFVMMAIDCFKNGIQKSYIKRFSKTLAVFFIVLIPFVGTIMFYNYYRFGSLFETGFQLLAARTGLDFFSGTPLFFGIRGFLASPGKGFFYYSPIAIFFFLAIASFYKKQPGRYLLAITPFFILPIAELLDSDRWIKKRSLVILPIYVVFALSILIQIAAVSVNYYNHFYNLQIDQNLNFSKVKGKGVPSIYEPPPGIYFDWTKSPILAQFKYIKRIGTQIIDYQYEELPQNATDREKVKAYPSMHIFDFWWVYMYYIYRSYTGFVGLLIFLAVVGICGIRMGKLSRRSSFQEEGSG
jgi:hypothetical protein